MALIRCPDCRGNVSSAAQVCTTCGRPVGPTVDRVDAAMGCFELMFRLVRGTVKLILYLVLMAVALIGVGLIMLAMQS
jgi:hypothetical protein